MKIDGFGLNSIYLNNNKVKNSKKKSTSELGKEYKVELSLDYEIKDNDYQTKVEEIAKAIKNGSYCIDLDKLASALVKEVFGSVK